MSPERPGRVVATWIFGATLVIGAALALASCGHAASSRLTTAPGPCSAVSISSLGQFPLRPWSASTNLLDQSGIDRSGSGVVGCRAGVGAPGSPRGAELPEVAVVEIATANLGSDAAARRWLAATLDRYDDTDGLQPPRASRVADARLEVGYVSYGNPTSVIDDLGGRGLADEAMGRRGPRIALVRVQGAPVENFSLRDDDLTALLAAAVTATSGFSETTPAAPPTSRTSPTSRTEEALLGAGTRLEREPLDLAPLLLGLGSCDDIEIDQLREAVGVAVVHDRQVGGQRSATVLECRFVDPADEASMLVEVALSSTAGGAQRWNNLYRVDRYLPLETPVGRLSWSGSDQRRLRVFFADPSGPEVHVSIRNQRLHPVSLTTALDVIDLGARSVAGRPPT